ncbi:MAG: N-acetylgalactosamine-6-sulfate sulfatase, partial [Lentisphaerae bacterium]|nr:N-acetylgalactosamine-6-sulfate sulfatase [Lentisphaerota bacterium]
IPRLMKQQGYRTALFGKWHLGVEPRQNPIHHGFHEFVGYLEGATDYHNHKDWYNGLQREEIKGYSTHLITDRAVRFIEENESTPFFLYVAHQAVHLPFQTPADTIENRPRGRLNNKEMWDPNRIRPKYKIMLEEMDKGIGQILDTIERVGLAENTFVFFFSDNGAILAGGSNKPLRGSKFSQYEGGHRVPAVAWWPGRIAAGTRTDATTMAMDLFPTIMDLASIPIPSERKLDGTSMKALLLDRAVFPQRQLFWGYEPKLGTAMRDGNWKMIVSSKKYELYNLENDIEESRNLVAEYPDRARAMKETIVTWSKAVSVPAGK